MPHDANKFAPVVPPSPSRLALRDRLATAGVPLGRERVSVPLPDGDTLEVEVRSVPSGIRWHLQDHAYDVDGNRVKAATFTPLLLAHAVYDPQSGERVWGDGDLEQIAALDVGVTGPLVEAALRVAGMARDTEGDAGNPSSAPAAPGSGPASA